MRCFVAIAPAEAATADLDDFLAVRREAAAFGWTDPENLHLTLAFLPRVEEWRLEELVDRLAAVAARTQPLQLRIAGGGAFPHPDAAKVLWAGLEIPPADRDRLTRLAANTRAAANRSGLVVDGARFRPHLTVARTRRPHQVSDWVRLLDAYRGPSWWVECLVLVRSHLGEGRARRSRYEQLASLPLGAPGQRGEVGDE